MLLFLRFIYVEKYNAAFIYLDSCKLFHLEMPNNLVIHHRDDRYFCCFQFLNLIFIITNHDVIIIHEYISSCIE